MGRCAIACNIFVWALRAQELNMKKKSNLDKIGEGEGGTRSHALNLRLNSTR